MQWEADPGCSARKQLHSSGVHRTAPLNCTQQIYQAAAAPHLRSGRKNPTHPERFPNVRAPHRLHARPDHTDRTARLGRSTKLASAGRRFPSLTRDEELPLAGSARCLTQRAAQPAHHHTGLMRLAWCLVPPFVQLRSRADAVEDLCLRKWGFLPQ